MSDETGEENIEFTDFSKEGAAEAPPAESAGDAEQGQVQATSEPALDTNGSNSDSGDDGTTRSAGDLEAVFDVPVNIAAVLGGTNMDVSDLLKLNEGDVVELDRKVGEAIDIFVNNRLVARGEVVLVEDRLGVTMTEIIKGEKN